VPQIALVANKVDANIQWCFIVHLRCGFECRQLLHKCWLRSLSFNGDI